MSSTRLTLQKVFDDNLKRRFSTTQLRVAARAAALAEIEQIRTRTWREGVDYKGNPLVAYSTGYKRYKAEFIKNGWRYKSGRGKKATFKSSNPTAFAADKVGQFMRLSGRLMSDMTVKTYTARQSNGSFTVNYTLDFKTQRSRRIAKYHNEDGVRGAFRRFWGPATRDKDIRAIKKAFMKELGL